MEMLTEILPALAFTIVIAAQVAAVPFVRSINYSDQPFPPRQKNCQLNGLDLPSQDQHVTQNGGLFIP